MESGFVEDPEGPRSGWAGPGASDWPPAPVGNPGQSIPVSYPGSGYGHIGQSDTWTRYKQRIIRRSPENDFSRQ